MEFKQDDSCSVQKSSCFLEIPFFKLSLTKGTLYNLESLNLVHIDKEYSDLREIIDDLNEEFSSVLVLFYYEDMSIKEISKVLEISEGTVKSRLSRAKSKLKALLKEEI